MNHTVSAFTPQKFSGKVWLWHQHQTKCSCSVFPDHFLKKVQKLHAVILMTSLHICKQEHSPNPGIVPDVAMIRSDCSPWFHWACCILFQKLLKLALRHFWGEAVVICWSVPKSVLLMWETFHDSHPCYLLQPPGTSNLWSHQHHLYIIKKHSISNSCRHKLVECRTLKHTGQLVWGNRSPNTQTAIARRSEINP